MVIGLAAASLFFLSGCVMTPYPVSGAWTQDVRVTLDGKIARGSKEGQACATSYAGLVGTGDVALLQFGADIFEQQGHALALLAAGCVSLLISGCGCLGVDGRRATRKALIQAAKS